MIEKQELVSELTNYLYDRDPYEYNDCYSSREEAEKDVDRVLRTKKSINLVLYELSEDMTWSEKYLVKNNKKGECEMYKEAKRLFDKITKYKKQLENQGLER